LPIADLKSGDSISSIARNFLNQQAFVLRLGRFQPEFPEGSQTNLQVHCTSLTLEWAGGTRSPVVIPEMASAKETDVAQGSRALFFELPNELIHYIWNLLTNGGIKNLRLANRRLKTCFRLRFDRVFISPSKRNIEVFRAIANHPEYRSHVSEIIWDDALFAEPGVVLDDPDYEGVDFSDDEDFALHNKLYDE
jgi:hypothetical protein